MRPVFSAKSGLAQRLEEQLPIPPQVVEAFGCDRRASFRFGQDKAALDHRLDVQGEAFRGPWTTNAVFAHRSADIAFQCFGMAADIPFASRAYVWMRPVALLDDRAYEASE